MADLVPIPSDDDGPGPGFAERSEPEFRPATEPTFAELVEAWHGPLYGFALCLVGNEEAAVQLTQQAFRRWIERSDRRVPRGEERRWLFVALYREFAGAETARAPVDRFRPVPGPTPAETADRRALLRPADIVAALQQVRIAARAPLAFLYAGNFTVSEIAEILGPSVAEVMERLASGKIQLAGALAKGCGLVSCA